MPTLGLACSNTAVLREQMAKRRNGFYVSLEKLWALLSSGRAKRILFSETPEWTEDIKSGFESLPHRIEFGSITAESSRGMTLSCH